MTVAATDRKAGPFTNSTTAPTAGPFAFTFKIFALTDVKVVRTTTTSATGATETLTYGTDYTVTANLTTQDTSPGGSITLTGDITAGTGSLLKPGYYLTILSNVAYSQLTALTNYDRFNPTTLNEVHDRAVALTQQLKEQNDRTLTVPATSDTSPDTFLQSIFTARDTAVTKASEASASATAAAASAASAAASVAGFDTHVAEKQAEFDTHVTTKTTAFDTHVTEKTTEFDTNATTKTTAFNTNATTKTTAFDSHVTQKTNDFDGHVISQTTNLDKHVAVTAASISTLADESKLNVAKAQTWAEGVDCAAITTSGGVVLATSNNVDLETRTHVEVLGGTHSSKVWAQLAESSETAAESAKTSAQSSASTATTKASEASASATQAATTAANFDTHAAEKTTAFDTNASTKTTAFDSNASSKTSAFDSNATSKTSAFDSNASAKTVTFDTNASNKTISFNTNSTDKLNAFNSNYVTKLGFIEGYVASCSDNARKSKAWAEGEDSQEITTTAGVLLTTTSGNQLKTQNEISILGGEHSAKKWAEISIAAQADFNETTSGSTSYIRNKPVIDTTTSASSTNAVTNAAITTRINEIWSWIYNQSGWTPILSTNGGVDLMTSTNEVILADHA